VVVVMDVPEGQADRAALALKKKNEGNAAFKERRYHKAIQLYAESLRMESNHLVFGNRAQSFIHLHQYELALRDLNEAMRINSTFAKNINRRARVLSHLGMTSEAILDYAAYLKLAPTDKEAYAEARALLEKKTALSVDMKQWNSGEEFEEDEMVEIPIGGLEQPEVDPTDTVVTPTVSSDVLLAVTTEAPPADAVPTAAVLEWIDEEEPVEEEMDEDAAAPPDTVEKKEKPVEEPTVPIVERVSEVTESSKTDIYEATVVEGAPVSNDDDANVEDTVSPMDDTVDEDEDRPTVKDTVPEELGDSDTTLVMETTPEDTVAVETVSPSEDTVAPLADTVLPTSPSMSTRSCTTTTRTSDETYASAIEPGSRTSNETYAIANDGAWVEEKDESFSSFSDSDDSSEESDGSSAALSTTPEDTEDEEEDAAPRKMTGGESQVSNFESSSTASVIAEITVDKKKEEEVNVVEKKKEEDVVILTKEEGEAIVAAWNEEKENIVLKKIEDEATVLKKEEKEVTVLEKEGQEAIVVMEKDQGLTVVEKSKKEKTGKREIKVVEPSIEIPPPAKNFSDFCDHFFLLKHNSKAFGKYFLSLSPSSLQSLFSNLLDVEHLKAIVDGLTEAANHEVADLSLISSSLFFVSLLDRFDLLVLFMNDDDKKKVFALIDLLPATAETKQIRDNFE
ncbi:hypothetical protein PMAYCL1PPCAC_19814, partial [Pristionchus mayeri]